MRVEIYTTGFYFTNSYVIINDKNECVIVDPGLNYGDAYKSIISRYKPLAILLTHAHMDHIDGLQYFSNLPIYMHKDEEKVFNDSEINLYDMIGRCQPYQTSDLDIRKLNDNDEFIISDFKFKVLHTPGHTCGSCCYLIDNYLFSGDTLFKDTCGRCDFPTGDYKKMGESLKRLVNELDGNIIVYPGHEDKTTILTEKLNNVCIPK